MQSNKMANLDTAAAAGELDDESPKEVGIRGGPARAPVRTGDGGFFRQYKGEQGKWTRVGTFVGLLALIAWGGKVVWDLLSPFQGDEAWRLLITTGIPILFMVALAALAWWVSFANRRASDFMIATEGEMKKVSWSTKREVIGSTKVVIFLVLLIALMLFLVDAAFQFLFSSIGVLKT